MSSQKAHVSADGAVAVSMTTSSSSSQGPKLLSPARWGSVPGQRDNQLSPNGLSPSRSQLVEQLQAQAGEAPETTVEGGQHHVLGDREGRQIGVCPQAG